ncbi:MAG: class I SAM-dependent methyltransferase [Taibaiella sp.]|nr:class I SAM-dependent methyltransferase [Taibaiella sp.]
MALKQHLDDQVRFDQQVENSASYVLPFIEKTHTIGPDTAVFEVGTAEGGVLRPFMERGCTALGVDLAPERIELAEGFLAKEIAEGKAEILLKNIYDADFLERFKGKFDIIILKDVIEHVPEQEKFIPYLKNFLKPGGQIFFGFPPWYMPFGGHQQVCRKKWAAVLPWYHILPRPLYKGILKMAGEHELVIKELMEVVDTQITIERFEKIIKASGLKVLHKQDYLINPIYKYKFGLQPRKQFGLLSAIPFFRNFVTTCVYYTVG